MSETPAIQPALSDKEWRERRVWTDYAYGVEVSVSADGVTIIDEDYYTGFTRTVDRAHGIAALCLYGQPFGFTHADVDCMESLAARLAALLPPNDTPAVATPEPEDAP